MIASKFGILNKIWNMITTKENKEISKTYTERTNKLTVIENIIGDLGVNLLASSLYDKNNN